MQLRTPYQKSSVDDEEGIKCGVLTELRIVFFLSLASLLSRQAAGIGSATTVSRAYQYYSVYRVAAKETTDFFPVSM